MIWPNLSPIPNSICSNCVCTLVENSKALFSSNQLGSCLKIIENYPRGYHCVFFSQIPVEERRQIRFDDGRPLLQGCVCSLFIDDKPNSPLLDEYVEIIGEDPIDYEIMDDYADSSKYATVKCKSCGKLYKVNRNPGYRTSFFKWSLI